MVSKSNSFNLTRKKFRRWLPNTVNTCFSIVNRNRNTVVISGKSARCNGFLESLDVWITGLRRDQSESRKQLRKAEIISSATHPVLKVSPLLQWTADEVWEFVRENEIPVNPLLEADAQGHYYESIGCVICTTPIKPGEPNRAGRWRWQNAPAASENADTEENAKECGLHYSI